VELLLAQAQKCAMLQILWLQSVNAEPLHVLIQLSVLIANVLNHVLPILTVFQLKCAFGTHAWINAIMSSVPIH